MVICAGVEVYTPISQPELRTLVAFTPPLPAADASGWLFPPVPKLVVPLDGVAAMASDVHASPASNIKAGNPPASKASPRRNEARNQPAGERS